MSFKKTKVVMLSTNEKAFSNLNLHGNVLSYTPAKHSNGQHLYFLSDEEIKEGDWCYRDTGTIFQMTKELFEYYKSIRGTDVHKRYKIIATTDSNLTIKTLLFVQGENKEIDVLLPQPSQSFVEKFVEEYNKGNVITEVMVEYLKGVTIVDELQWENKELHLKVNPKDNTIAIRKVKDSWNREEFMKFGNWCRIHDSKFPNQVWTIQQLFDKWIEENL